MMPYNIPLDNLGLTVPYMDVIVPPNTVLQRPITDHPPIIQTTAWGTIGTMNILHPGSPIAPPLQKNGVSTLPVNGQVQMEAMADYIFDMFSKGVGMLALQEVPDPSTANFSFLYNRLKLLVADSQLIDVDALAQQWLKTGRHAFGTSVLCNPAKFKVSTPATSYLNDRAAVYQVTTAIGDVIPVANTHGDYTRQHDTLKFLSHFDGICLGDLNVTNTVVLPQVNPTDLQSMETPSFNIDGTNCTLGTLDCIQDTYSKKYAIGFIPDMQNTHDSLVKARILPVFQPVPL